MENATFEFDRKRNSQNVQTTDFKLDKVSVDIREVNIFIVVLMIQYDGVMIFIGILHLQNERVN